MNAMTKLLVSRLFKVCLGICLLALGTIPTQARFDAGLLPMWFEVKHDADKLLFTANGKDSSVLIDSHQVQFIFSRSDGSAGVAFMDFAGSSPDAVLSGENSLAGRIHRLESLNGITKSEDLAAFGGVCISNVYPGINAVFHGNQQQLEYDFNLAPGVDPGQIRLNFRGVDSVRVTAEGDLMVKLAGRSILQHRPVATQFGASGLVSVPVRYEWKRDGTIGFWVGEHDSRRALLIDPVLSYSTFFGGNNIDIAWAVAYGTNDSSVYIAGQTMSVLVSAGVPFTTPKAFETNYTGSGGVGMAFVAKFRDLVNPTQLNDLATNLVYCTYLGGSQGDLAKAVAVDASGHAFVAGDTLSPDFPTTNAVVTTNFNGSKLSSQFDPNLNAYASDGFVAELETNGSSLIYSTYLGGQAYDSIFGLALDDKGDAFVTGFTCSTNFPVTYNAFQPKFRSVYNFFLGANAFVSEIAAGGKVLNYSSYLGGTNVDIGYAVACNNQYLAVAGATSSSNFPTINFINQKLAPDYTYNGGILNDSSNNYNNNLVDSPFFVFDGFVTLFPLSGSSLGTPLYSTLLGGTNTDVAYGVALDSAGNAYVTGGTTSTNFPITSNPGQLSMGSYNATNQFGVVVTNAFLTQLKFNGNAPPQIGFSQEFGGFGNDVAYGVATDPAGNVFIVGSTSSLTNYFATPNNLIGSLNATNTGLANVFVAGFQAGFTNQLFGADFGSYFEDFGYGIAVAPDDSIFVVGQTLSGSPSPLQFPSVNAWEPIAPDNQNGFLTKIFTKPPTLPTLSITSAGTNLLVKWSAVPLEQVNTNSFVLQVNSSLRFLSSFTNVYIQTNYLPYSTNFYYVTNQQIIPNLVMASNWVPTLQLPQSTNVVLNGFTNQIYTYTFPRTNSQQYYQLRTLY